LSATTTHDHADLDDERARQREEGQGLVHPELGLDDDSPKQRDR
jgi:hypothetical protein